MREGTGGIWTLHYELHEVEPYVNWLYFFNAWGFPARYGNVARIHDCPSCRAQWLASFPDAEKPKAQEAMKLYDDALVLLHNLDGQIQTHAIVGLYEANGENENILLKQGMKVKDEGLRVKGEEQSLQLAFSQELDIRLPLLRQQHGETCLCWADFLPPVESGQTGIIGLFVTSVDEKMINSEHTDDYHLMLAQTLADRLAEATAERMHEEVRKTYWGYASDEHLTMQELHVEKFQGIRPAVGYPSLPDTSINFLIDKLIDLQQIGIRLTESGAMKPHASVSGFMLAHPKARYFSLGKIGEDQLADYACRRGLPLSVMRKFLT